MRKPTLLVTLFSLFAVNAFAQVNLPFTETFNAAYSSNFYSAAGTSNSGTTYTCTSFNGVGLITSADYLTTKTLYVHQGQGVSLSFKLNKGGSFSGPVKVYLRVSDATLFSSTTPSNNGWVEIGTASTFSCGTNSFSIPAEISGGQKLSFTIDFKSASSTNWVAIEDLSITEVAGGSVQTSFTENFTIDEWYPGSGSGYVHIPYHSNTSASNGYTWLFSNGVGGPFDYCAAFYTGFDGSSGTNLITPEINTGGYANGELRFAFKSQYPCGGPTSYTFDEDYSFYAPEVYIMEGADNGTNAWVRLPVKYYFPDATWRYATVDISAYKNANVKFKFERGGFCSSPAEAVDNIKVFDRNCTVSSQPAGTISGSSNIAANTDYAYSISTVTGAGYYKWTVRSGGTTYIGAPYIVSGQGTPNVTVNFGNLPAPLRVLCIPYDADPTLNNDACYATTAYLSTSSCSPDTASVSIIASTTAICPGQQVDFTATPVNGGSTPAYQWKVNNTNSGTNSATFSTTALNTNDVVTVIMTSSETCITNSPDTSNAITITVTSNGTASVSISASDTAICAGGQVDFTAAPVNEGLTPTYQWKVNGGNVGTNSPTFSSTTLNNTDVVTVVLTSSLNCISGSPATSNAIPISVTAGGTAHVSIVASADTICPGAQVDFTATPANGGTTPTYQWKINGNNVGTNSPAFSSTTLNDGDSVTVEMTSNAGCVTGSPATSSPLTITVTPGLTASVNIIASSTTICPGTQVDFTATPTHGGATPAYQWKVNGNNTGTNSATFSSTTLSDNDVVTVDMTSSDNCVGSATVTSGPVTITVTNNLTASVIISADTTTICPGGQVDFTATPTNGGTAPTYQWKVNGNNVGTNSPTFGSTTLNNNDTVTVEMISNNSCVSSQTVASNALTITVSNNLPASVIIAASSDTTCPGALVDFTATPANGGSNPTYQWKVNGNNAGTNSVTFSTTTLSNNDVVNVEMTSSAGCVSNPVAISNSIPITVGINTAGAIVADKDTLCAWQTAQFILLGSSGSPIVWQSSFSSSNNFNTIPGADNDTINAPITIQSTYYRAIVGSGVCADTTSVILIVVPASPVSVFTGITSHNQVTFNSSASQGASIYHWDFGDGDTSTVANPIHLYADSGSYDVCLVVTNSSSCSDTLCTDVAAGVAVGIADLTRGNGFTVYPNPSSQFVQLVSSTPAMQPLTVHVYDAVGKRVLLIESLKGNFIDVSALDAGIYLLELSNQGMKPQFLKLAVVR